MFDLSIKLIMLIKQIKVQTIAANQVNHANQANQGSDNEMGHGLAIGLVSSHKDKSNTSNQQLITCPTAYPCPNFY